MNEVPLCSSVCTGAKLAWEHQTIPGNLKRKTRAPSRPTSRVRPQSLFFLFCITPSLELSDTKVYEP